MNPLISVIVPCYNQAQYLDECLQSVFDQTYQDWECIIVNDGSPDHTEEIAKKWLKKDARFKYIYKKNGGLSSARNAGITNAKGEWVLPLDADDKIGNQYMELAEKEFVKNPSIIYCKAEFFGTSNKNWDLASYDYKVILRYNQIFCSAFFRKQNWIDCGGYDENLKYGREDWDLWLSILCPESLVIKLNYIGFFYRRKEISMDVELIKNKEIRDEIENYIYKKHLEKYLLNNTNAIEAYIETQSNNKQLEYYKSILHKNIFTRFLFKIVRNI